MKSINGELINIAMNKNEKSVEFDQTAYFNRLNSDLDASLSYANKPAENVAPLPTTNPSGDETIKIHKKNKRYKNRKYKSRFLSIPFQSASVEPNNKTLKAKLMMHKRTRSSSPNGHQMFTKRNYDSVHTK
mmetsp:Transcript_31813/g.28173  ORF Transcript_31813/g.28173 Transcript_31813/m.28173 type:complete len:131 (+) Transcript_31813:376-768(+)